MNHTRGYSDFFTSGIRLASSRFANSPRLEAPKVLSPISLTFDTTPSKHDTKISTATSRTRPTSMIVAPPKSTHEKNQGRQRRFSLVSIPSRLFNRKPRSVSNDDSCWASSPHSESTPSFHDAVDFWDMTGSSNQPFPVPPFYVPSCPNGGIEHPQPIDPFSRSPTSKSFFVDLPEIPRTRRGTSCSTSSDSSDSSSSIFSSKRDSFLHVKSTPPPGASFLYLPRGRHGQTHERSSSAPTLTSSLNTPTTPTTTPPPSTNGSFRSRTRSRVSSFFSRPSSISVTIPETEDWDHFSLVEPIVIEEEEALVSATDAFAGDDDAPAKMDWRQFHIELLASHD